jgi:proteasome lid subunit RPN8/RPN11
VPGTTIRITARILRQLIDHARQNPQVECCGVLAGCDGIITHAFPGGNIAANPATSYEVATKEIVRVMREIRAAGLELSGIYHSHPNGRGEPSDTDIATVGYPDVAYFIISPPADLEKAVRAFLIQAGQVAELKLLIV